MVFSTIYKLNKHVKNRPQIYITLIRKKFIFSRYCPKRILNEMGLSSENLPLSYTSAFVWFRDKGTCFLFTKYFKDVDSANMTWLDGGMVLTLTHIIGLRSVKVSVNWTKSVVKKVLLLLSKVKCSVRANFWRFFCWSISLLEVCAETVDDWKLF